MLPKPRHLMSLADLSAPEIKRLIAHSFALKHYSKPWADPPIGNVIKQNSGSTPLLPFQSLLGKTVALLFSKRSTRTRLAAETSLALLGGRGLFLGREDIQMGVNETVRDTAHIISGMCQGIMARVGEHEEIEELAKYADIPVINGLSSLWHPTQILADILTLHENASAFTHSHKPRSLAKAETAQPSPTLPELPPLTVAYIGDSANVLHDMLVTYPRLGHTLRVASPRQYRAPKEVWDRVWGLGCDERIEWVEDPKEALKGANVVYTDTWISMGQEAEKEERLRAFKGYQVTEALCKEGGADPNWIFLHCLPRKPHEVDDEVFFGPRSLVFPQAANRKWTTMAVFDLMVGHWKIDIPKAKAGFQE
ncbi:hypothetical protein CVT26_016117 [Gymnopilus dilepis]|uniref:ornithine carbamoyltransferase n=1 Tax=Gymnopilus dilepis TaxID=231916 RepID=A0A409XZ07_9AGAR|nr:hypothetical protein CVT26_016117 [Gymnopilus dilepis]